MQVLEQREQRQTCLHFAESRQNSTEGQEKSACFFVPVGRLRRGRRQTRRNKHLQLTISLTLLKQNFYETKSIFNARPNDRATVYD